MNSTNSQSVVGATESNSYIKLANYCSFVVYYTLEYTLSNNQRVELMGSSIYFYSLYTINIPEDASNISLTVFSSVGPNCNVVIGNKYFSSSGQYCLLLSGTLSDPSLKEMDCSSLVPPTPPTSGPPSTVTPPLCTPCPCLPMGAFPMGANCSSMPYACPMIMF